MKEKFKIQKNKSVLIGVIIILIMLFVTAVTIYNQKLTEAKNTAFDNVTLNAKKEYKNTIEAKKENVNSSDMVEVKKNKEEEEDTVVISSEPTSLDLSKEGNYDVKYVVKTRDSFGNFQTKEYTITFTIKAIDDTAPVIEIKEEEIAINEGDEYNLEDNIKSVKDDFDGKLKKVETKPTEQTAYYLIDADLDTSKAGEYTVKVIACDKAGNEATKEFKVIVKEKKTTTPSNNINNSSNNANTSTNANNAGTVDYNSNNSTSNNQSSSNDEQSSANNTQITCKTIHHEATGHNETIWVQDSAAYDESVFQGTVIVCNACQQEVSSLKELDEHAAPYVANDDWSHLSYHTTPKYATIHHEATGHNETIWVQDSAEYDEQVCEW